MRSMFAAISGLKNHQTFMDVVGNNIANVNTTGFKQSRVTFQDILSQTERGASGPQGGLGGVNPQQVGLGTMLSGIQTIQTQGTLQSTGKLTDMAIQGDGYFVVNDGKQNFYSRDGSFDVGIDGTLVNPANGMHVQGWQANATTGLINTANPPTNITIPVGAGMTGKASTRQTITGNLDATAVAGQPSGTVALSTTVYDTEGNAIPIQFTLTKAAAPSVNTWNVALPAVPAGPISAITWGTGPGQNPSPLVFNTNGLITQPLPPAPPAATGTLNVTLTNGATVGPLTVDFSQLTQLASTPSNLASNTDGASAGSLTTFTVGQAGDITGIYSNGFKQPLGQIALASFSNPSGLMKAGGNLFSTSSNSGNAQIGVANSAGRGQIATGFLEASNVDLAQQFTNMIMAERGFQANAKVITASDEILQDLNQLKR